MAQTATIDLNVLQAVSLFASTEETRYYLNGVLLEIEAASVTYVATDGHRMFAYRKLQFDPPDNTLLGTFIIPTSECNLFKRSKRSGTGAKISSDGDGYLRFDYLEYAKIFKPIDGVFPAWRRVAAGAKSENGAPILNFDWDHLATFQKAEKMIGIGKACLIPGGAGAAIVHFDSGHDVFGMVMPKPLPKMPKTVIPEWVAPPAAPEAPPAEQAA